MSLMTVLLFGAGIVLLIWGADLLVRGAARVAAPAGISPLVIGLTVVAMGTSAPELVVSLRAVFVGQADLTLGNVLGSNIANVLLILGLAALAAPLLVAPRVLQREVPTMIGVSLLLASTQAANLRVFSAAMLSFVIPLTLVTIAVVTVRNLRQSRQAPVA